MTVTVTVDYATGDGTATAGSDYTATSGTLLCTPGQTSKTFSVPILNDTADEADETVTLTLSSPGNATLGTPNPATVTLVENDVDAPPVEVGVPPDPSQPVTVSVNTPAGTVQITLYDAQVGGTATTLVAALLQI